MVETKKEFIGITINEAHFQGKVVEKPVIGKQGDDNRYATLQLKVHTNELGANGQWTQNPMIIPLIVLDQNKVGTVEKYIDVGRDLHVRAYYKAWADPESKAEKHGFIVTMIILGTKPYVPKDESNPGAPPA